MEFVDSGFALGQCGKEDALHFRNCRRDNSDGSADCGFGKSISSVFGDLNLGKVVAQTA